MHIPYKNISPWSLSLPIPLLLCPQICLCLALSPDLLNQTKHKSSSDSNLMKTWPRGQKNAI